MGRRTFRRFAGLPYNPRMWGGILAVGAGAALGAWLRWGLAAWLNPRVPHFPLGTLAANLIGGYLVGFAVAYFAFRHDLAPRTLVDLSIGTPCDPPPAAVVEALSKRSFRLPLTASA